MAAGSVLEEDWKPKVKPEAEPELEAAVPNEPNPFSSALVPGFLFWQATHSRASSLFCKQHTSQSQAPGGFLNLSPNPSRAPPDGMGALTAEGGAAVPVGAVEPGLAVWQDTHLES